MMRTLGIFLAAMLSAACAPVSTPRVDLSGSQGGILLVVSVANVYRPARQASEMQVALVPDGARRSGGFGDDR